MSCSDFCRQFWALANKNRILKLRQIGTLLLEILVPTIIIILLGVLATALPPTNYNQITPSQYLYSASFRQNDPFNVYNGPQLCYGSKGNIIWNCNKNVDCKPTTTPTPGTSPTADLKNLLSQCKAKKIAVAPESSSNEAQNQAAIYFQEYAEANYDFLNLSTFVYFSSESNFTSYIGQSSYGISSSIPIYSAAVIFHSGYPTWQYTLRLNYSYSYQGQSYSQPSTNSNPLNIALRSSEQLPNTGLSYVQSYFAMGESALADIVNSFVSYYSCYKVGNCTLAEPVLVETLGGVQFPSGASTVVAFWSAAGSIFALLMILALLYPVANVIRALVQEKETKIKEGMKMMSLRGDAHILSWIFHFMCLFLPLAIILTLAGQKLFTYSSPTYIFFYFILFFMSSTAYAFLVAQLFNRALTAAIVGCVVYFMGYFIFIGLQSGSVQPTTSQVLAASLHPACAFTYGTLAFSEYESAQIGVTANTWNTSNTYPVTFQLTLTMMFIDTIYLGILAWYFGKIWPSEFGTHQPWYFIVNPYYYFSVFQDCMGVKRVAHNRVGADDGSSDATVPTEPVPDSLSSQIETNLCVDIRKLYKEFHTESGVKVAVNNLDLTIYSGQITALLGHNGAGKTTTIAMLTGLAIPDGGTAIIEGLDITTDLAAVRRNLGVCPQHDVVSESLIF